MWPGLVGVLPTWCTARHDLGRCSKLVSNDFMEPWLDLPKLLIASKSDLDPDPEEAMVLEELLGLRLPAPTVSARAGEGLDQLGPFLFWALEIVR